MADKSGRVLGPEDGADVVGSAVPADADDVEDKRFQFHCDVHLGEKEDSQVEERGSEHQAPPPLVDYLGYLS